jgi:hypothetical protein
MPKTHQSSGSLLNVTRQEQLLFSALFTVTFLVLLVIAGLAGAVGLKWRGWFPGVPEMTSFVDGVRAAVGSLVSQMFLG